MSIPVNLLRWAGVWDVTSTYSQYDFVQSPITSLCYIYVGVPDIVGGGDPSVPNPLWVQLNPPAGTGITSLNGLIDPAMSIVSSDASIKVSPVAPDKVDTSRWGYIPYGSFSSTQTFVLAPGVPTALVYDTKDIASTTGVNVLFPSPSIQVTDAGVYKVLSSIQCDSTGGNQILTAYPAVNGTPVPNSATQLLVGNIGAVCLTVEWFLQLNANDSVEILLYDPAGGGRALAIPAVVGPPPIPAIPSVITTILRIA